MKNICLFKTFKSSQRLVSESHDEIHVWHHDWKECTAHKILPGSGRSTELSRGPRDKYANVARHMSKTHARANIFMTLFLGRETQLGIRIYSPHVAMRQWWPYSVQMAIWGYVSLTHWDGNLRVMQRARPFTLAGISWLTLQSVPWVFVS